jgi:hypothetical protein
MLRTRGMHVLLGILHSSYKHASCKLQLHETFSCMRVLFLQVSWRPMLLPVLV